MYGYVHIELFFLIAVNIVFEIRGEGDSALGSLDAD